MNATNPAARLNAIARQFDPANSRSRDFDKIDRLIALADAALPDCDLEPALGSEACGHPGSDECEVEPDLEESLSFTDGRARHLRDIWAVDLELEDGL